MKLQLNRQNGVNKNQNRIKLNQLKYSAHALKPEIPDIQTRIIKDRFFKIHPQNQLNAIVACLQNRWYLLDGSLVDEYGYQLSHISQATLLQGLTEHGETFLMPITEPWPGYPESWKDSLFEIAEQAKYEWVKINPNHAEKCYQTSETSRFNSRLLVNWPQEDFETIVNQAFVGDLFIDSVEHPLIKELLQA